MRQNDGDPMVILGVTGTLGSGKSMVLEYLNRKYRAYTVQADEVGHQVMRRGQSCYDEVVRIFGKRILSPNGEINRGKLGDIVFTTPNLLNKLNKVIHPAVIEEIQKKTDIERKNGCKLFVVEAALLLEERYDDFCDDVWYVRVDDNIRRERLKSGRGMTDKKITEILSNQLDEVTFFNRCSYLLDNSGDPEETYKKIDERVSTYGIV